MFCTSCGNQMSSNAHFCSRCGKDNSLSSGSVGFSSKINDPAFEKYKKASRSWSFLFSFILLVAAAVGMPLYGKLSGEIDWPASLYYGLGIGGMFVVIALLQTMKRSHDRTWDGTVIDKNSFKRREETDSDDYTTHTYYNLIIQKDNGGKVKHQFEDISGPYSYYNIGDRVRHHKGFIYYEKYDKSKDSVIMCAACLTMNPVEQQYCSRCKCPLLK